MELDEAVVYGVGAALVLGSGMFFYARLVNEAVAASFTLLGDTNMTLIGFITFLIVCVTVLGAVIAVCMTFYKLKQLSLDAARQERLDKFDRELLTGKKSASDDRTLSHPYR